MSAAGRVIIVQARPEPIRIAIAQTAVLVVDMQNDFGTRGGMFDRAGIDISAIQQVVPPTARVMNAARKAGIRVVYLTMEYRPDLSDAGGSESPNWLKHRPLGVGQGVRAPDGRESRILISGTWNTAILSDLAPEERDIVISKHRYSGFYQTDLDLTLRTIGAKYLVVTGCTTSVCVESTIRDAMSRSNHEASLLVIERLFGWVSSSGEFLSALGS